jgi:uncharacterized membrane protein YhaH (DUF805 family)
LTFEGDLNTAHLNPLLTPLRQHQLIFRGARYMNLFELLYGFQGRISRSQWWMGQLALLSMLGLFYVFWSGWLATNQLTGQLLQSADPAARRLVLAILLVLSAVISTVMVWTAFSLAIKRVHDQGRSGWRTLAYGLPILFAEIMPEKGFTFVATVIAVWYVLELGCFRGYPRHNQYGPATTPDDGVLQPAESNLGTDLFEKCVMTPAYTDASNSKLRTSSPATGPDTTDERPSGFGRRSMAKA